MGAVCPPPPDSATDGDGTTRGHRGEGLLVPVRPAHDEVDLVDVSEAEPDFWGAAREHALAACLHLGGHELVVGASGANPGSDREAVGSSAVLEVYP